MNASGPPSPIFWELVVQLKAAGASRELMLQCLKEKGIEGEDANVLVNSVVGVLPSTIPSAQFSPGTNVQLPSQLSLSDIGLIGPPAVVGLYWAGLGVAILLSLGIGAVFTWSGLVALPEGVGFYGLRVGLFTSALCTVWGLLRFIQGRLNSSN